MKNLITKQTNTVKISLSDFHKNMLNGSIGHDLCEHSADSYLSQLKHILAKHAIAEEEFLTFNPFDIDSLTELFVDDQKNNSTFNRNTFNAFLSALNCYRNYLDLKYNGVVVVRRRKRTNYGQKRVCNKTKCKSILWKILNALGLLKYI
jgi:hypothetical protein